MALQALGKGLAMRCAMASGALWHYFRIVIFRRNVSVKLSVAFQAIKPVTAVAVFQPGVFSLVTSAAFNRLH